MECVEVCGTGALAERGAARRPTAGEPSSPPRDTRRALSADRGYPRPVPTDRIAGAGCASAQPTGSVWTQSDAAAVLLVMLGSLMALDYVLGLRIVAIMPESGRVFARVAGLAATYGAELIAIALLARRHGAGLAGALGLRPVARTLKSAGISTGLVIALVVGSRALTSVYGLITQALEWEPKIRWTTDLTRIFGGGWAGLALAIALVALIGPAVEEIAFRGVVQPALGRRFGPPAGIAVTALLFGIYHFDLWMFVPTFVLGLALGWLAENRRGLWPPIALHVLYNAVTVVAVFWVAAN